MITLISISIQDGLSPFRWYSRSIIRYKYLKMSEHRAPRRICTKQQTQSFARIPRQKVKAAKNGSPVNDERNRATHPTCNRRNQKCFSVCTVRGQHVCEHSTRNTQRPQQSRYGAVNCDAAQQSRLRIQMQVTHHLDDHEEQKKGRPKTRGETQWRGDEKMPFKRLEWFGLHGTVVSCNWYGKCKVRLWQRRVLHFSEKTPFSKNFLLQFELDAWPKNAL